jgi:hypothetical protein
MAEVEWKNIDDYEKEVVICAKQRGKILPRHERISGGILLIYVTLGLLFSSLPINI